VSFTKSRLRRIESASRRSYRCPECGFAPDVPGRIVIVGEGFGEVDEHDPEERCERCGRWLWFVIEVVYDSPAEAEGGGGYRWP
jgi:DNA-directed RNA polymerase subunit RPC12/RpoP